MDPQMFFSLFLAPLFLFFFLFKLFKRPKSHGTKIVLPPGPWKLPLIGNLHQLAGSLPHRALRDLSRKYGPLMYLQLGQVPTVVVSSPRVALEVMKTQDISFADRPKPAATKIVVYDGTDVAFSAYGDYWRQMKKICTMELLSAKKVESFGPIRRQELAKLIQSIQSSSGVPFNLSENILTLVNAIICRATFGENYKDQALMIELIKELLRLAGGIYVADSFPNFEFLTVLSGMRPMLMKIHKRFDKILDDIFEEHTVRKNNGEAGEEDLVDVLFRLKEDGRLEHPITFENIKAVIMDMFLAGTDTSSLTIEWAMTEMMKNPGVMEKVQAELRQAFKGKKIITESDLQELHYLKLVVKETLRLHPPGPLLLPRECRQQCKIDGYDIPVKTKVIVNAWACATDPEYWEDAESFKPERFENRSVDFIGTNFEFIPFGAGRRICPGISFGLVTVEFSLAQLLYHFDWKLPNEMKPEDLDMTETEGVGVGKKVHLHLIPTSYSAV